MEKPTLARNEINVPADVPAKSKKTYVDNYYNATHGTGRLMLFAGDQKIEHLNDDFYGTADTGQIPPDDADPEHLFRIASRATIGIFASQLGLIAKYGPEYKDINYIVKLNSKSHMVKTDQKDPRSMSMWTVQDAVDLRENAGLKIVGIGYTIYLGSEYEGEMLREAAQAIKDPHLSAGATGVAACIGADFVKVNPPKKDGADSAELLKEATLSAGNRTRVICAGGSSVDPTKFLETLHRQIHIGGVMGNATGRNIHQKPLLEAIRLCNAISSITLGNFTVEKAIQVYEGKEKFAIK